MTIGVDVSKDTLVCSQRDGDPFEVANSVQGVKRLLAKLCSGATVAMEATGRYHRLLADTAYSKGFDVVVLNPKDVNRYTNSVSPRAVTDPIAAQTIAEFASIRKRRSYVPPPAFVDAIRNLVRTRAGLVKQRVALANQSREHAGIADCLAEAISKINESVAKLEKQIVELAKNRPEYKLLIKVPGFGPLIGAYMTAMLASGDFRSSDAFVAFVGLDLRVRESGKFKGRRKLSKRGDPETRHLLYLAALVASQHPGPFSQLRNRYLSLGFSKTEAAVFIARKLARVAWAVYTKQVPYDPQRVLNQPSARPTPRSLRETDTAAKALHRRIGEPITACNTGGFRNNQKAKKPHTTNHSQEKTLDTGA